MNMNSEKISQIKQWFWNVISCGLPMDDDLETLRKLILLNLIIILGGFFITLLSAVAFIQGDFVLGAVDLAILSLVVCLFLYLKKTINYHLVGIMGTVATGMFYFFPDRLRRCQ